VGTLQALMRRSIGPLVPLGALAAGTHLWWGIGVLVSLGIFGNIGQAANQALITPNELRSGGASGALAAARRDEPPREQER
jgi:hypothetical protein